MDHLSDFPRTAASVSARAARLDRAAARLGANGAGEAAPVAGVWRVLGEGPPLVLIHGGSGSWLHWLPVLETLTARHRCYVPDMPGFGAMRDDIPPTLDALAELVEHDLVALFGDEPFALAAFSFGALVGGRLARSERLNVTRLSLVGPAGLPGPERRRPNLVPVKSDGASDPYAAARHNLLTLMVSSAEAATEEAVRAQVYHSIPKPFRTRAHSYSDDLGQSLPHVRAPIAVLVARLDVTMADGFERRMDIVRDLTGNAPLHIADNAGHWIMQERPDWVASRL